jgi:hypothetical protein
LNGVKELNKKYSNVEKTPFSISTGTECSIRNHEKWMGWERKRGALMEFNQLLNRVDNTSYSILSCNMDRIPKVDYVITLDADTLLPIDGAKRMIGTLAHPLNRPVINKEKGIVTEGYGLIQPRIILTWRVPTNLLFSRIFTGQEGIDPYACAVSDIYQDIFEEAFLQARVIIT